ncbi:general odorant-binding protein 19a-like [Phymastichus coffea]|uniref:general odorant-binding protein 19a-like n=1 Tax=Phymastichus coffea TaxID=108790 RepID=UPI00273B9285|nr:general odorant-binding protein 19a-like [Phymastichus coffea]
MKIQVILCPIAISFAFMDHTYAGVTRAQMENLANGIRKGCAKKVGADLALVEGIRNGQFLEGNTALKCYTKCVMIMMKTLRGNRGDLNVLKKQIKAMASEDVADKLISAASQCYSEIAIMTDLCEYTWRYTICTYKKDPENKMKLLFRIATFSLILLVLETANAKMTMDQIRNTLRPFKTSCLKKTGVDFDLVEGTKLGNFPEERSLMCFCKCVMQMMKVAKNGEILINAMMQQVDLMMPDEYVDEMKSIITNCGNEASTKEDACESSFVFVRCFYRSNSNLYFFP